KPLQELFARPEIVAEESPGRAVAVNGHTPFPFIDAASCTVSDGVDEHQDIARCQLAFDRPLDSVDAGIHSGIIIIVDRLRMPDVGFVASRYNHRCAITGSNIGERAQNVDLAAMEFAGMITVLRPDRTDIAAGVQADCASLRADGAKIFIDKDRTVMSVKILRVIRSDKMFDLFVPGWMVDQLFPHWACLVKLL